MTPLTDDEVKEFWKLFGPHPVLKTEDEEAYETIRKEYVAFYRPTSRRHISFIRELVDTEWEMFGLVKIRTKLLRRNYQKEGQKQSCNLLERPFWDIPALDNGVALLDRLDKWRNTGTVRRDNLLKMIEYYLPAPDDNASIPEAEFKKALRSIAWSTTSHVPGRGRCEQCGVSSRSVDHSKHKGTMNDHAVRSLCAKHN